MAFDFVRTKLLVAVERNIDVKRADAVLCALLRDVAAAVCAFPEDAPPGALLLPHWFPALAPVATLALTSLMGEIHALASRDGMMDFVWGGYPSALVRGAAIRWSTACAEQLASLNASMNGLVFIPDAAFSRVVSRWFDCDPLNKGAAVDSIRCTMQAARRMGILNHVVSSELRRAVVKGMTVLGLPDLVRSINEAHEEDDAHAQSGPHCTKAARYTDEAVADVVAVIAAIPTRSAEARQAQRDLVAYFRGRRESRRAAVFAAFFARHGALEDDRECEREAVGKKRKQAGRGDGTDGKRRRKDRDEGGSDDD